MKRKELSLVNMASFYGEGSEEAAARFEADYFAGDEMFQLDVQPVEPGGRRVVEPDPFLGFNPTREPSRSQAPILQPPSWSEKMPPSCGAVRLPAASCDILAPAYKRSLLRDDEALGDQPLGVWGVHCRPFPSAALTRLVIDCFMTTQ